MKKWIIGFFIGATGGLVLSSGGMLPLEAQQLEEAEERREDSIYEGLDLFGEILDRVRASYVEDVEDEELLKAAINGMLASLDPHSSYLPPKRYEDMRVQTRGEFGGLGIEVTMKDGLVRVVSPIDNTPAAAAGMQPNDFITHIDGETVLGLTLSQAVDRMRGPVGTAITLTVVREGEDEPLQVEIVRDIIRIRAVRARLEGDIGVLRITTFNEQTYGNLHDAVDDLNQQAGESGVVGYVVDLRNNPGGLLKQAIAVSDAFLEKGEIVSTRGRQLEGSERYNAGAGDLADGKPLVVLVNGGSASASEIVAGALQDHRRAIIVGERTFGKGSVQSIMPLEGEGAIRLTTARYYTPSGRSIQALGIEPDILVEPAILAKQEQEPRGPERHEADLPGRLDNDNGGTGADGLADEDALEKEEERHERVSELRHTDYQLAYALDLIHGVAVFDMLMKTR